MAAVRIRRWHSTRAGFAPHCPARKKGAVHRPAPPPPFRFRQLAEQASPPRPSQSSAVPTQPQDSSRALPSTVDSQ